MLYFFNTDFYQTCFVGVNGAFLTAAVLAQSVERVDCREGGRGFDSWGRTNTQGLKITEK